LEKKSIEESDKLIEKYDKILRTAGAATVLISFFRKEIAVVTNLLKIANEAYIEQLENEIEKLESENSEKKLEEGGDFGGGGAGGTFEGNYNTEEKLESYNYNRLNDLKSKLAGAEGFSGAIEYFTLQGQINSLEEDMYEAFMDVKKERKIELIQNPEKLNKAVYENTQIRILYFKNNLFN